MAKRDYKLRPALGSGPGKLFAKPFTEAAALGVSLAGALGVIVVMAGRPQIAVLVTSVAVATAIGAATFTIARHLHRWLTRRTPWSHLRLGIDGLVLNDRFVHWDDFKRCDVLGGRLRVQTRSAGWLFANAVSGTERGSDGDEHYASIDSIVSEVCKAHQAYLQRPTVLADDAADDAGSVKEGYRTSNRQQLVRIVTDPGAETATRVEAVRALRGDPRVRVEIERLLEDTLDESVVEPLRRALGEDAER